MTDFWEERISAHSDALLVGEHEVRYRFARPVVEQSSVWCDLGCGTGAASSRALADVLPDDVVLVDADADAAAEAARAFASSRVETRTVDLTSPAALRELGERLGRSGGPAVVTCFEVIEHLSDFGPLVEWLDGLVAAGGTAVLSVPHDAFTAVKNPFHLTMWGSSTVEEFRRLLPPDQVLATQIVLAGSLVAEDPPRGAVAVDGSVTPDGVPVQYLVGIGPARDLLAPASVVLPADVAGQRVWERQREVDNLYYRSVAAEADSLRAQVADLQAELADLRSGLDGRR